MNHKKKKSRNATSGCKMCKGWKIEGISKNNAVFEKFSDHKRRIFAAKDIQKEGRDVLQ